MGDVPDHDERLRSHSEQPVIPCREEVACEVTDRLRMFCSPEDHHFWPDSVSLTDESLFQLPFVLGHKNITDAYLLGLAVRNHGRLATFDRNIPLKAVRGAEPRNLVLISSASEGRSLTQFPQNLPQHPEKHRDVA